MVLDNSGQAGSLLRKRDRAKLYTITWLLIVGASIGSWAFSSVHGAQWPGAAIVGLAWVKTYAIGAVFMDVKRAPKGARIGFLGVITAMWVGIFFLFRQVVI